MKYFSMFSGIGGFELGIEKAWRSANNSKKTEISNTKGDKSISKRQQERNVSKENSYDTSTSQNQSGTLLQNRQEQSYSQPTNLEEFKINITFRQQIRQAGYGVLRERDGIRDVKKSLLRQWNISNIGK